MRQRPTGDRGVLDDETGGRRIGGRDTAGGGAVRGRRTRRQAAAYQGAFEAVFAILIGAGLGYWGDASLGTSPWLLLLGFVLGFGAFVLRLLRLGGRLQESESGEPAEPSEPDE